MALKNPVKLAFERVEAYDSDVPMTIEGTLTKLSFLLLSMAVAAAGGWWLFFSESRLTGPLVTVSFITGLILGVIAVFRPTTASYIAIPYSLCQGLSLGVISAFAEIKYPGIATAVITLTTSTAAGMLFLYRSGIVKVTDTVKAIILSATAAIALTYSIMLVLNLFGILPRAFYENTSTTSIIFSLFAVAIAAANLLLDFALIEESVERRLPRYMEWYGAFTVIVTLVWLYIEILRLAQKLAKKR